ncbi:MAG: acylphosphatase [Chlorobiaceae bacterium]|nr:acylphosphatase [Chlorobiaceae bacterium]NTV61377.1 acylphosphatase [Chlorobiaceae bacterium]
MRRVRLKAAGFVQGVGYRMFIHMAATELYLCGWVRNSPDGSVDIDAQGTEEAVEELIRRAGKGPSRSRVSSLLVEELLPSPEMTGFSVMM